MLTLLYIGLAVLGCGYVVVSLLTGHLVDAFGGGGAGHAGGGEAGGLDYGVDGGGHGSVSASDPGGAAFHFPLFSPLAVATLFATIGGYGLVAKYGLRVGDGASLVIAVPLAVATAYAVTYLGWRLVTGSRGSSEIRPAQLVGAPAEVLTPIPAGGVGEVAATVGGQRFTGPARAAGGREIGRGAAVTVVRVVGGTLVVAAEEPKGGA